MRSLAGMARLVRFLERLPLPAAVTRPAVWLVELIAQMVREYQEDSLGDQAAAMSFWTVLSIPAAALALVTGLGSLDGIIGVDLAADARMAISDYVESTFGSDALTSTVNGLFEETRSGLLTVGLAVALYSLARGFAGTVRGLDVAYDIHTSRSWINVRLTGLTLAMSSLAVVAIGVWMVYVVWPASAGPLLDVLGVVALLVGVAAWATMVFHVAPDHRTPWKYDIPGAIMSTLLWLALIRGFAVYVRLADNGNGAVGVAGAALLAFTLVYLLNVVLLLGAELNAILADRAGVAQPPRRLHHLLSTRRATRRDDAG